MLDAYYFVCVNGDDVFESNSLTDCRKICKAVKSLAKNDKSVTIDGKTYEKVTECFIGMYNIDYVQD